MQKVYVIVGLDCEEKQDWLNHHKDSIHVSADNTVEPKYTSKDRWAIIQNKLAQHANQSIIFDNIILTNKDRRRLKDYLYKLNREVSYESIIFFVDPLRSFNFRDKDDTDVSFKLFKLFNYPDEYFTKIYSKNTLNKSYPLNEYASKLIDDHDTSYHLEKISEHILNYAHLAPTEKIRQVGFWHDLGKYFSRSPWAHVYIYHGHEHLSAYIYQAYHGEAMDSEVFSMILNHTAYHDFENWRGDTLQPSSKEWEIAEILNDLDTRARIKYPVLEKVLLEGTAHKVYQLRSPHELHEIDSKIAKQEAYMDIDWTRISRKRKEILALVGKKFNKRTGEAVKE